MGEIKFFIKVENNNIVDIKPNADQLTESKPLKEASIHSFIEKMFSETDHKDESLENFKEDLYDSYGDVVDSDEETDVQISNKQESSGLSITSHKKEESTDEKTVSTLVENALTKELNPPSQNEENNLAVETQLVSTLVKNALEKELNPPSQNEENNLAVEPQLVSTLVKNALEKELVSKSISALIEHALKNVFSAKNR